MGCNRKGETCTMGLRIDSLLKKIRIFLTIALLAGSPVLSLAAAAGGGDDSKARLSRAASDDEEDVKTKPKPKGAPQLVQPQWVPSWRVATAKEEKAIMCHMVMDRLANLLPDVCCADALQTWNENRRLKPYSLSISPENLPEKIRGRAVFPECEFIPFADGGDVAFVEFLENIWPIISKTAACITVLREQGDCLPTSLQKTLLANLADHMNNTLFSAEMCKFLKHYVEESHFFETRAGNMLADNVWRVISAFENFQMSLMLEEYFPAVFARFLNVIHEQQRGRHRYAFDKRKPPRRQEDRFVKPTKQRRKKPKNPPPF